MHPDHGDLITEIIDTLHELIAFALHLATLPIKIALSLAGAVS